MARAELNPEQLAFSAGEISPIMSGRIDLPKYGYGCKTLQNMLLFLQGPTFRRPGTEFIGQTVASSVAPLSLTHTTAISNVTELQRISWGYATFDTAAGTIAVGETVTFQTTKTAVVREITYITETTGTIRWDTLSTGANIANGNVLNHGDDTVTINTVPVSPATMMAGNYYLTANINAAGVNFRPLGTYDSLPFTGTFDGCGYTIRNLTITDAALTTGAGLFAYLDGATVYNLTIKDAVITVYSNCGLLAGYALNACIIQEVTVSGTIDVTTGGFAAGLIADAGSSGNVVRNCTVASVVITFTGNSAYCGLFFGRFQGTCTDCCASGTLVMKKGQWLGGFVGQPFAGTTFIRCRVEGIIPAQSTFAEVSSNAYITNGGFAGKLTSPYNQTFTSCYYLRTLNDRPFGGSDEVQRFNFGETPGNGPTGGHYHIIFDGITSASIPYNCTQAQAQTACDAAFGSSVLEIGSDYPIKGNRFQYVYFRKAYSRLDVAMITVDCSALAGPESPYTAEIAVDSEAQYGASATVPIGLDVVPGIAGNIRLLPFIFSHTDAYIIEMGDGYLRFYRTNPVTKATGLIAKVYAAWAAATAYAVGNLVTYDGSYYRCLVAHTSGAFAADLASGKWFLTNGITDLAYQIPHVFAPGEFNDVHFDQIEDLMYLCHSVHPIQKSVRYDHDNWKIDDAPITNGPFLPENKKQIVLTPSGTSGNITLTASYPAWVTATEYNVSDLVKNTDSYKCLVAHTAGAFATDLSAGKWVLTTFAGIFTAKHVGALWLLTQNRKSATVSGSFSGTGQSAKIGVQENTSIRVTTHGSWTGTLVVEKSYDGTTWDAVFSIDVAADDNMLEEFEETVDSCFYRLNMTSGGSGCKYNLSVLSYEWHTIVRITGGTATVATAVVLNAKYGIQTTMATEEVAQQEGKGLAARPARYWARRIAFAVKRSAASLASTTSTKRWCEGAWSLEQGYPTTLTFFQQRLFVASKSHRAPRIWASQNFTFEDFFEGPDADDALYFYLSTTKANPIVWLTPSSESILIGTSYQSSSIQPVNIEGGIQTFSGPGGSGAIQPDKFEAGKLSGNTVIFIERQGQKVCQIAYSVDVYNYMVVEDISVLAEHITKPSIIQMAFQQQPIPILWMVRSDGVLVSMVYSRVHGIAAFATHPMTNGFVESVAVIPSAVTGQDEVWLVVKRTIGGVDKRYIERLNPIELDADIKDCQYVDSSLTYEGAPALTISGLDHLKLQTVSILDNGYVRANQQVTAGGLITVAAAWVTAHAYIVGDLVTQGGSYYRCIVAHTSGTFSIDLAAACWLLTTAVKVIIGLPYTSTLETLDLQFAFQNGSTKGKKIKIPELNLDLYNTGSGVKYGPDADNLIELDLGAGLFSGIWPQQERGMPFKGSFEKEISVMITQSKPLPLVVRSIVPRVVVEGFP